MTPGRTISYGEKGIAVVLRNRLAIKYAVQGDLRFISHQDTLRLFIRALARARVPVRHSAGFNPRPRVSIVLPRPVGVASICELLVLELTADEDPIEVLSRLATAMPDGIELLEAERLAEQDRRLPTEVQYALQLEPQACRDAAAAASEFMAKQSVVVERTNPARPAPKKVDIRKFMVSIEVEDGVLLWTQAIAPEGTVRVGELLDCLGLPSGDLLHRVLRKAISYRL